MKRINPQQLPNLTQDTHMKRLNYVKLLSQSGFRPHELPKLSRDTITSDGIVAANQRLRVIREYWDQTMTVPFLIDKTAHERLKSLPNDFIRAFE